MQGKSHLTVGGSSALLISNAAHHSSGYGDVFMDSFQMMHPIKIPSVD